MSPYIIWIPNIHDLDGNEGIQKNLLPEAFNGELLPYLLSLKVGFVLDNIGFLVRFCGFQDPILGVTKSYFEK